MYHPAALILKNILVWDLSDSLQPDFLFTSFVMPLQGAGF